MDGHQRNLMRFLHQSGNKSECGAEEYRFSRYEVRAEKVIGILQESSRHHSFHDDSPAFVGMPYIWMVGDGIVFFSRTHGNKVQPGLLYQIGEMGIGEQGDGVTSRTKRTTQANQGQDISVTSDRDN